MDRNQLLQDVKAVLGGVHGARLQGVVLYGSEARGTAEPGSDVDLLVLLTGPIRTGADLQANIDALYPLALQLGRRISAKPVDVEEYETVDCPLYRSAHQEGIAA